MNKKKLIISFLVVMLVSTSPVVSALTTISETKKDLSNEDKKETPIENNKPLCFGKATIIVTVTCTEPGHGTWSMHADVLIKFGGIFTFPLFGFIFSQSGETDYNGICRFNVLSSKNLGAIYTVFTSPKIGGNYAPCYPQLVLVKAGETVSVEFNYIRFSD